MRQVIDTSGLTAADFPVVADPAVYVDVTNRTVVNKKDNGNVAKPLATRETTRDTRNHCTNGFSVRRWFLAGARAARGASSTTCDVRGLSTDERSGADGAAPRRDDPGMPLLLSSRAVLVPPVPLVSSREARALGLRLSPGIHLRVRHGIYADAPAVARLKPWERYALRVHAFARDHPESTLCLESAAVLHGIPLFSECRDIHVFDAGRRSSRRFGDVAVHTSADPRAVDHVGGIAVTSLLDTVCDLARVLPPAHALAAVDATISPVQVGTLDPTAIAACGTERSSTRGRAKASWVLDHADGRAASPGESVSRAVIDWTGFEHPVLHPVFRYEGFEDRADFLFPTSGAIGESHGWRKYDLDDPDAARRHLAAEKRREDRLRRHHSGFARWDLADALRVEPLMRALRAASVRLARPTDHARLATLRRTPHLLTRARS